jgi:hypothetical protein
MKFGAPDTGQQQGGTEAVPQQKPTRICGIDGHASA